MIAMAVVNLLEGVVTVSRLDEENVALCLGEKLYEGDVLDTQAGSLQVKLASGTLVDIPLGLAFKVNLANLSQVHVDPSAFALESSREEKPSMTLNYYYVLLVALLLMAGVPAIVTVRDHLNEDRLADSDEDEGGTAFSLGAFYGLAQVVSGYVTKGVEGVEKLSLEFDTSVEESKPKEQAPVAADDGAAGINDGVQQPLVNIVDLGAADVSAGFPSSGGEGDSSGPPPSAVTFVPRENDFPDLFPQSPESNSIVVREETLGVAASGNYSSLFAVDPGLDGLASQSFALMVDNGADSGLLHTVSGDRVLLFQTAPKTVVGLSENGGEPIFEVNVNDAGIVNLRQTAGLFHLPATDINQILADILFLTTTVIDGNGDPVSDLVDIGPTLKFIDHLPSLSPDTPVTVDLEVNPSNYIRALGGLENADKGGEVFFVDIDKKQVLDDQGDPIRIDGQDLFFHIPDPLDPHPTIAYATPDANILVIDDAAFTLRLELLIDTYSLHMTHVDGKLWREQRLEVDVGLNDGDGDSVVDTLLFDMARGLYVVGTGAEDIQGSTTPYLVGVGSGGSESGPITGKLTQDLLIGDGGTLATIEGDASYVFIADVSGSMNIFIPSGVDGSTLVERIEALKQTYTELFTQLHNSQSGAISVILISFSTTAKTVGTFDLKDDAGFAAALAAVASLGVDPFPGKLFTNYEAAYKEAILAIDAADDGFKNATTRQVIITTDGEPNRYVVDSDGSIPLATSELATQELEGAGGASTPPDVSDEISIIEQGGDIDIFISPTETRSITLAEFGPIDAVGIQLSSPTALAILDRIEANADERPGGNADNVSSATELTNTLLSLTLPAVVGQGGRDTLIGNEGPDTLIGDALDSDQLIIDKGLEGVLPLGSNVEVFIYLESDDDPAWHQQDTIEYILDNIDELTAELTPLARLKAGNDSMDGGPGNDALYGQGGDDDIVGGLGEDLINGGSGSANVLTGGVADSTPIMSDEAPDTFEFNFANLSLDGSRWEIKDFEKDFDVLSFNDLLDSNGSGDGDLADLFAGFNHPTDPITFTDDGTNVTVEFSNTLAPVGMTTATIVFLGAGTGAVTSFGDLVTDASAQLQYALET